MKFLGSITSTLLLTHGAWSQFLEAPPTPADRNTINDCTYWHVAASSDTCASIASGYGLTVEQFARYNPSVAGTCSLVTGNSYCVEQNYGHLPQTTSTGRAVATTSSATSTGNGITTPTPTQEGMVKNCNKFHFVAEGEGCASIASKYGVSVAQLFAWNPAIGSGCTNVWHSTYLCVGVMGGGTATTTTSSRGDSTPTSTQPGMVSGCNRFRKVVSGEICATIASRYGISLATFYSWSPGVGKNCESLWLDTYYCVGRA